MTNRQIGPYTTADALARMARPNHTAGIAQRRNQAASLPTRKWYIRPSKHAVMAMSVVASEACASRFGSQANNATDNLPPHGPASSFPICQPYQSSSHQNKRLVTRIQNRMVLKSV